MRRPFEVNKNGELRNQNHHLTHRLQEKFKIHNVKNRVFQPKNSKMSFNKWSFIQNQRKKNRLDLILRRPKAP